MNLKINEFEKVAKDRGYESGIGLWVELGGGDLAYALVKQGMRIGHEIVKNIYNEFGEEQTLKLVVFDDETISGLKAKYIQVGNSLLGGIPPHDGEEPFDVDDYSAEHIRLFSDKLYNNRLYPDWYFTKEFCEINKRRFKKWMRRNSYSWECVSDEIGISVELIYWKLSLRKKWTMMDLICLLELMGKIDLFNVISFHSHKLRADIRQMIFKTYKE